MPEVAWSQTNVISEWANKQDSESLLKFLDEKLETGRPDGQLYVSQDTDNSTLFKNPDSGYCAHKLKSLQLRDNPILGCNNSKYKHLLDRASVITLRMAERSFANDK